MPAYSMRSFSILLIAQSISMFGNSLTSFALGVWVFKEVGSATIYALIALANAIPMVLLSPIAGAVVDRMNRKIIILAAQLAAMTITALLMFLYSIDALQPWHIIALVALNSIFLAFVFPAVTATTPLMVPKEQLIRANGMIALAMGVIQLISPAISGSLYEDIGLTLIFSIDLLGYVFAIVAVTLTFIPQPCPIETAKNKDENMFTAIKEGWHYLLGNPGLKNSMLIYSMVVSMLISMSIMIQPMILAFTDAKTLGFIMSFAGGGMLFGSALMIVLKNINRHMPMIFTTTLLAGLLSALAPASKTPWLLALCGFIILSCFPIYDTNNRALLQRKVHSNMIGRVIGLRNFALGICNGLVLMISGLLSDKVFNPAMLESGWLTPYVGNIFGAGQGRGIALMISILGAITFIMGLVTWSIKSVRTLDTALADVETPVLEEDAILKTHA